MILRKNGGALLALALVVMPTTALAGLGLLSGSKQSEPETAQASDEQPLLDGLRRTGDRLGDGLTRTNDELSEGLDRTFSQLGDGLRETLAGSGEGLSESLNRLSEGSAELGQRLSGRFVETVDGSEAIEIAVSHQGLGRRVVIVRPETPALEPAPAMLLLHYAYGTPERMANLARVSRLAAERGAWIILPEAVNRQWRENPNGLNLVDDIAFLEKVVTVVTRDYPIDAARIHLAGMSKGGFMATHMACQSEFPFAGLALIAAGMRRQQDLQCPLERPLPVIAAHGTRDFIVPYDGRLGLLSANANFDRWATQNGCDPASEAIEARPSAVDDGTSVIERTNRDCAANSAVQLLTVEGGGHTWPGSIPVFGISLGPTSGNLDATFAIWDFLEGSTP